MNKRHLAQEIANRTGLTRPQAAAALDAMTTVIRESLAAGEPVQIRGFGQFTAPHSGPRTALNPRTGEQIEVPARRRIRFRPGKPLEAAVRT